MRTVILFEHRRGRAFFKVSSNISGEEMKALYAVQRQAQISPQACESAC